MKKIANIDIKNYGLIRKNVKFFLSSCADKYDGESISLLDIAPQDHEGAKEFFKKSRISTLDIDSNSGATFIADICKNNSEIIPDNYFDIIVCTEVLEHTLNPFLAIKEMKRMLKSGGLLLISAPFNFRIHGPLPDCWRFTEHGLKELLKDFKIEIKILETKNRFLMPVHYTIEAVRT